MCVPLLVGDNLTEYFIRVKSYIRTKIEKYVRYGSGFVFDRLHFARLEIAKYSPLSASGKVQVLKVIKDMHFVLNIHSPDNKCFLYCLLAKLFPVSRKSNPSKYTKYLDKINEIDMGKAESYFYISV